MPPKHVGEGSVSPMDGDENPFDTRNATLETWPLSKIPSHYDAIANTEDFETDRDKIKLRRVAATEEFVMWEKPHNFATFVAAVSELYGSWEEQADCGFAIHIGVATNNVDFENLKGPIAHTLDGADHADQRARQAADMIQDQLNQVASTGPGIPEKPELIVLKLYVCSIYAEDVAVS